MNGDGERINKKIQLKQNIWWRIIGLKKKRECTWLRGIVRGKWECENGRRKKVLELKAVRLKRNRCGADIQGVNDGYK